MSKERVIVAMSGGVDSSVTAALLKERGYDCVGVFLRNGIESKHSCGHKGCCSATDAADARTIAHRLGIPFYSLNFEQDFKGLINYFVREYNNGRTPNPCVMCNEHLKFGKLSRYAEAMGARYVATGHYARIVRTAGRAELHCGVDQTKDQSYVLFGTLPDQIDHMLLPMGEYQKHEVRAMAERMKLPVFAKPDSQEICFVPDNQYFNLIKERSPDAVQGGKIVDGDGNELGEHDGYQQFTIGQRRGVGVAAGHPIYVTNIDPNTATVTVGPREQLLRPTLQASRFNWLIDRPNDPVRINAKIRYNHEGAAATAHAIAEDKVEVSFDEPQSAITPGQAVVIYQGTKVLGGGWIDGVSHAKPQTREVIQDNPS